MQQDEMHSIKTRLEIQAETYKVLKLLVRQFITT